MTVAEHVDLDDLVADIPACRERGCLRTYMDRATGTIEDDDGTALAYDQWIVTHRTAERWATFQVSVYVVEDALMWPSVLRHETERSHQVMDSLGERPAVGTEAQSWTK